jgi:diguanylate cyclase (GGDEF)-like protein
VLLLAPPLAVAQDTLRAQLENAIAARYRSPAEARALDAALRQRLRVERDPVVEAQTWLNDCETFIEEDGKAALAAAASGVRVLEEARVEDPVLRLSLELCEHHADEYLGKPNESLVGYDRIVDEATRLSAPQLEADARVRRGELRSYLGRFADGLEDLKAARAIFLERGRDNDALYSLQAIATLYYRLGDYDRAIEYFNEVVPERERRGQTYMLGDALYNLARALEGKGDFDGALHNFEQMRAISRQIGSPTGVAYAEQSIGALRLKRGEAATALELFESSLEGFRRVEDRDMIARLQNFRGTALQQLGRVDDALLAVNEAVRLYREIDNRPGLEKAYGLQAALLIARSDFERAVGALQLEREVHAGLDAQRRDESLAQQRAQFDAEKKEQENKVLEARRQADAAALESSTRLGQLKTLVIVLVVALLSVAGGFLLRQVRLARRLRVLALVDELTGIANRRSVLAFLDEQIRLHRAAGKPLSVILLDIDHFKRLNDTHGHAIGDGALKAVSGVCQHLMRGHDRIGRTGGEEFLGVLPEAPLARAGEVAERLCEQVRRLDLSHLAPGLRVTISIGVSEWRPSDPDAQAVVSRADAALYAAKAAGRDRVMLDAGA